MPQRADAPARKRCVSSRRRGFLSSQQQQPVMQFHIEITRDTTGVSTKVIYRTIVDEIWEPAERLDVGFALSGKRGAQMQRQERRLPHVEPMRCDHCRKSFGLILHRYFRMRFCSADCLSAYQRRLDDLTMIKIQSLEQPRALPR